MSRPPDYEWAVLGEGQDPIPGDPYEVRAEATRIGKMAQTIHDQINLLKDIAGDDNVGKFADKVKDKNFSEIAGVAEEFGRRQPLAFLGLAAIAGLAASRFMMASKPTTPSTLPISGATKETQNA